MLNGLVKNQDGLYSLTEKGKLAIRLMEEFCERKSQSVQDAPFPRGYYIVVGLFSSIFLILEMGLFISGIINLQSLAEYMATTVFGIVFLVFAERARRRRAMSKPSSQMLGAKLSLIFAGAFAGGVILFFSGGLVIGLLRIWTFTFDSWIITSFTIGSIIGGFVGYGIYKKSKLSKIDYYTPF